jgi:hypothetical protein
MNNIHTNGQEKHKHDVSSHSNFANTRQIIFETYNLIVRIRSWNKHCISSTCVNSNCVDTATGTVIFDLHVNTSLQPICLSAYMDVQAKHILRLLPWNLDTN